jgi:hypothetical protein
MIAGTQVALPAGPRWVRRDDECMQTPENRVSADAAGLAAAIERAANDLAIGEEPAGFVLALEGDASPAEPRD